MPPLADDAAGRLAGYRHPVRWEPAKVMTWSVIERSATAAAIRPKNGCGLTTEIAQRVHTRRSPRLDAGCAAGLPDRFARLTHRACLVEVDHRQLRTGQHRGRTASYGDARRSPRRPPRCTHQSDRGLCSAGRYTSKTARMALSTCSSSSSVAPPRCSTRRRRGGRSISIANAQPSPPDPHSQQRAGSESMTCIA